MQIPGNGYIHDPLATVRKLRYTLTYVVHIKYSSVRFVYHHRHDGLRSTGGGMPQRHLPVRGTGHWSRINTIISNIYMQHHSSLPIFSRLTIGFACLHVDLRLQRVAQCVARVGASRSGAQ